MIRGFSKTRSIWISILLTLCVKLFVNVIAAHMACSSHIHVVAGLQPTRLVLPKKKVMIEDSNPWMLKPRFWIWRFLMWDLCSSSIPPFPWWAMGSSNCNGIYHLDKGKPDLATVTDAEGTKPSFKSQTHGSEQVWWKQQKILILFVRGAIHRNYCTEKCWVIFKFGFLGKMNEMFK